jgi:hypothetical protein
MFDGRPLITQWPWCLHHRDHTSWRRRPLGRLLSTSHCLVLRRRTAPRFSPAPTSCSSHDLRATGVSWRWVSHAFASMNLGVPEEQAGSERRDAGHGDQQQEAGVINAIDGCYSGEPIDGRGRKHEPVATRTDGCRRVVATRPITHSFDHWREQTEHNNGNESRAEDLTLAWN